MSNSDVDVSKVITMQCYLEVLGTDNTIGYFLPHRQYEYDTTEMREVVLYNNCGLYGDSEYVTMLHYKVWNTAETAYYWIPEIYCAVEGKLRTQRDQDFNKWIEEVLCQDQPRDYYGVFEKATGFDLLSAQRQVHHNGYDYYQKWLREKGTNNGKVYKRFYTED